MLTYNLVKRAGGGHPALNAISFSAAITYQVQEIAGRQDVGVDVFLDYFRVVVAGYNMLCIQGHGALLEYIDTGMVPDNIEFWSDRRENRVVP